MIGRRAAAMAGLLMLGACAQIDNRPLVSTDATAASRDALYNTISPSLDRTVERAVSQTPFANGALSVVAPDGPADLATYRLVPCQGGQAICAGGEGGPVGQLRQTPDWFVVTGLYGRTFWLSYGGDGYVERGGEYWPLAWNARPNGTGDGDAPALETPFPHGYRTLEERVDTPVGALGNIGLSTIPIGNPPQAQGPGRPLPLGSEGN